MPASRKNNTISRSRETSTSIEAPTQNPVARPNMSASAILSWLDEIPNDCRADTAQPPACKRRRLNPPTPDSSTISYDKDIAFLDMPTSRKASPHKRQEPGGAETPRSKRFRSDIDLEPSELSAASGRLSPSKQLRALRHQPDGIEYRELSDFDNKPASLRSLLKSIDTVMEGQGIVASSHHPALLQAAEDDGDVFDWAASGASYYFSDGRDQFGQTPSVENVLRILDKAIQCSQGDHHEDAWNNFVHTPLLELAFHPTGQRIKHQFITAASW
ncbi:hypothetical protein AUP68_18109 [Ilyonectria robusta]